MEILKIEDEIIEYRLERKKIKNCYISIKDASVIVKVPTKTPKEKVEELISKRTKWIFENVEKQREKVKKNYEYINGEIFKVLGKDAELNISYEKMKKPKLRYWLNKILVTLPLEYQENSKEKVKELVEQFYAELAQKEVGRAMQKITKKVGIAPNSYKVKNLKSTWGNCSITGNISINKEVVKYSRHAIEYVCLHEICHLQNMNHSRLFWDMVANYMPDFKEPEEELKN